MFNNVKKKLVAQLGDQIDYAEELKREFATLATKDYLHILSSAKHALRCPWCSLDSLDARYSELREATLYLELEIARAEGLDVGHYDRIKAMRAYQHLEKPLQLRGLQFAFVHYDGWRIEAENTGRFVLMAKYNRESVLMLEVFLQSLDAIGNQFRAEGKSVRADKSYLDICGQVALKSSQNDLQRQAAYILSSIKALAASSDSIEAETAQAFLKASQYKPENLQLTVRSEVDIANLEGIHKDMLKAIAARRDFVNGQLDACKSTVFEKLSTIANEAGFRVEFRKNRFMITVKLDNKVRKFWRWYKHSAVIKVPYTRKGALLAYNLLKTAIQTVTINDDMVQVESKFKELEKSLFGANCVTDTPDMPERQAVNLRKEG